MSIIPAHAHPSWCDPRCCLVLGPEDVEHRSTPTVWKPAAADVELSIGLTRLDITDPEFPDIGTVRAILRVTDTTLTNPDGTHPFTETDLDPADARMLAASSVCAAENVEAERYRQAVTR